MNSCLAKLDGLGEWEDDLEVEELSSIQSATLVIIIVVGPVPTFPNTALTSVLPPM